MAQELSKVDQYFAKLPDERREALTTLRQLILENAPTVKETMSHKMPTFELEHGEGEMVCAIASQKHHMALYMDVDLVDKYKDELAGLDFATSCIRFKRIDNLPLDTIRKIVRETVAKQLG